MKLYLHIPFCKSKCIYCDFKSFPCADRNKINEYLIGLNKEITLAGAEFSSREITSVYFGGGTPSLLNLEQFSSVFNTLSNSFNLSNNIEITVECNPESVSKEKLQLMRSLGVNRISLGVQSLLDDNLKAIGRVHDRQTALDKIRLAKEYLGNLSVDFIVGLPYDTFESIKEEIEEVAPFVDHISVYMLSVESGTPLEKLVESGKMILPDTDRQVDFFEHACKVLKDLGFERYEVSNFSKNGKRSNHNTGYWTREEYLGLGLNASSLTKIEKENGVVEERFKNTDDIEKYLLDARNSSSYFDFQRETTVLTNDEIYEETVMLALRLKDGIEESFLGSRANILKEKFADFITVANGRISLDDKGMDVMNHILVEILS